MYSLSLIYTHTFEIYYAGKWFIRSLALSLNEESRVTETNKHGGSWGRRLGRASHTLPPVFLVAVTCRAGAGVV